jgi:hypothetical protein
MMKLSTTDVKLSTTEDTGDTEVKTQNGFPLRVLGVLSGGEFG